MDRLEPDSSFYNVPFILRLEGELQTEALARAVEDLAQRHEVLRTRYVMQDGQPVQREGQEQIVLAVADYRGEGEGASQAAQVAARDEAQRPFDLEHGPLFRANLFQIAEQDQLLVLNFHHSVIDGWSVGVLSRELSALYEAHAAGRTATLQS